MRSKLKKESCNCQTQNGKTRCRVETTLTIDDRGQMVIPKELRTRADIKGGDKLALVSWEKDGKIESISILKIEVLSELMNQSKIGGIVP